MNRRTLLRSSVSVASLSAISGCSSLGGSGPFTVIIDYNGQWSGSVGSEDGQRSVQGSGRGEFEIEGDVVSAVAQKRDARSGRLTVSIASGNNVLKRQSTTAQYGTVSVSHRKGGDDEVSQDRSSQDGGNNQQSLPTVEFNIVIGYDGPWSGTIRAKQAAIKNIEGSGNALYRVENESILVTVQKEDDGERELTVVLGIGEDPMRSKSTTEPGGEVSVRLYSNSKDEIPDE